MSIRENRLMQLAFTLTFALLSAVLPARAADPDCTTCHAALTEKKAEVHAAVPMGCTGCHADIDASAMPHKNKGKIAKGLSAEAPDLCANCHDKKLFEGKVTHAPVAGGMCLGCHNPHASDHVGLLNKEPVKLCQECHADVTKKPHAGFPRGGHPLGHEKRVVQDPLRKGKNFYCIGCHEPHRSEQVKLTRFGKGMMACQQCHKM